MSGQGDAPSLELAVLTATLDRLGFATEVAEGQDQVWVMLSGDDAEDERRPMAVRSVPAAGDVDAGLRLLMFRTSYPFSAPADRIDEVRLAAAEITQYLQLGHVQVDDDGQLHLQHTMLIEADQPLSDAVLGHLVALLDHQQQHFGDYLAQSCAGEIPASLFAELVARGEQLGLS